MIDSKTILDTSIAYSKANPNRNIGSVMLQLSSETGEMCDWVNRPWRQKEIFAGECADVINCVVDALFMHYRASHDKEWVTDEQVAELTIKSLNEQIKLKCEKWRKAVANV